MTDRERYEWMTNHFLTCQECELLNEDNSSHLCAELEWFFAHPPAPSGAERSGAAEAAP